jgi:putative membrane protein
MKTLILNVDRDDDFGRKAKIKSPIIGIKDNLEAANRLGQTDPEDSDLNAIFSAIAAYNTYKEEKKEVEIATICGHIKVGLKSDEILAKQLEETIDLTKANTVVLITDGAEDESIIPIIQSRIKITSIIRVAVKQSRELEDAYYRILKILDDEKVQKQFLLPIALVLIVWAFLVLLNLAAFGFGAMLLTLGFYLLIRVFRWERNLAVICKEIKSGFMTGRLSIYTYFLAIVILIVFGFFAYTNTNFNTNVEILPTLSFINNMIWGIVIAALVALFGRVVDVYVRDKKAPWTFWIVPFSLFAAGFIASAIFTALYKALINWPNKFDVNYFLTINFIGYTATGIMIALVGAVTYHYIKEIHYTEEKNLEIEKQTTKVLEKN